MKAVGFGGRQGGHPGRPAGPLQEVGNIWDHFAIEFEYPNGVHVSSYCTHLQGVKTDQSESVWGTKGSSYITGYQINKKPVAERRGAINPYVQEHIDLIQSIKAGKPLNELQAVTESTMTAILGRTAAYSGKELKWDDMLKSEVATMPVGLTMDMALDAPPVPVPGPKFKV